MRFREHRGSLDESLATAVDLPDDAALHAHISTLLKPWGFNLCQVSRKPYSYDRRINCDLDIVTVDGYGVMGFIDTPRPPPLASGEHNPTD